MAFNPFSHKRVGESIQDAPDYAVMQRDAYAVPPLSSGDAYIDEFGWAPTLAQRTSTVDVPSAQRLRTIPRIDYRPDPVRPPDEWYGRKDADDFRRHSVEDQDANGWMTPSGVTSSDRRFAPNPRSTPPAESRPTQRMGPRTYSFTRPFDQFNRTYDGSPPTGSARALNGTHFSMADHRRQYDILGMAPVRSRRNTYRLEPAPWDVDIVDLPPTDQPTVAESRVRSVELPSTSRSWRL